MLNQKSNKNLVKSDKTQTAQRQRTVTEGTEAGTGSLPTEWEPGHPEASRLSAELSAYLAGKEHRTPRGLSVSHRGNRDSFGFVSGYSVLFWEDGLFFLAFRVGFLVRTGLRSVRMGACPFWVSDWLIDNQIFDFLIIGLGYRIFGVQLAGF